MENLASLIYGSPETIVAQVIECRIGPNKAVGCFLCTIRKGAPY